MYQTSIERLPIEFCGMLGGIERTIQTFEAPWSDSHWRNNERMLEAAAAGGARTILGGQWGDQIFFDHTYLVDLLRSLRLPTLMAHLSTLPKWMGGHRHWLAKQTVRQTVKSFLPKVARPLVQAYRRKNAPMHRDQPWYSETFRAAARRAWPVYAPAKKRFISRAARARYQDAHAKYYTQAMEMFNKAGAAAGVQYEFPALDQDLLEFLMRVPGEQVASGGVHRGLLREAMRGIVPESIRQRRSKGNFTSIETEMVAAQYADLVRFFAESSMIERLGILDRTQLERAMLSIPGRLDEDGCRLAWDLSDLVALEVWMSTYFGNMPSQNKVAPREQPVYFG
jgi:asparagine synthetase B (glutamine-hydrolysing)